VVVFFIGDEPGEIMIYMYKKGKTKYIHICY
jgi:hypothetical protein